MATYTLQILNESGFNKSYVFFMTPPVVTTTGASPEIFTNAWVTFNSVGQGSYDTVTYTDTTYAFWGTTPSQLAPGVILASGGSALVDTTAQDEVTFIASPTAFSAPPVPGKAQTGSFAIVANSDFVAADNYVFGLAQASSTPIPAPVATFVAEPNDTFNITPVVTFYVADGAYTAGEVIDYSSVSTTAAQIDFTGRPETTATVTQGTNGLFTIQYS
ncbi:hypothetical protein [Caulobacter soli]|uniref:hypothetical protein n=1 Tax=Caulobacter soli TaxID=2708539 RepID=UPI0013E9BCE6|nr:hypothetical protein [Caulobacter soli]